MNQPEVENNHLFSSAGGSSSGRGYKRNNTKIQPLQMLAVYHTTDQNDLLDSKEMSQDMLLESVMPMKPVAQSTRNTINQQNQLVQDFKVNQQDNNLSSIMAATEAEVFSLDMCDDRPPTFREQCQTELADAKDHINGINKFENFFQTEKQIEDRRFQHQTDIDNQNKQIQQSGKPLGYKRSASKQEQVRDFDARGQRMFSIKHSDQSSHSFGDSENFDNDEMLI